MKNKELDISVTLIKEKPLWQKTLAKLAYYDFYHTFDYHELSKLDNEISVLIKYIEGNNIICLPLIIRPIEGTPYFDATSVYGYAGPLRNNIDTDFNNTYFKKYLNDFLIEENIISVFSRLHPFIEEQESTLKNIGLIKELGNVVYVNLNETFQTQELGFSHTTKRYLKKIKKSSLEIKKSKKLDALEAFIDLYYKNMDRVNAHKNYYFSKDYFLSFFNSDEFEAVIVYAVDKETNNTISAALIIKTNKIIQYHLSGTHKDYLHLSPLRAILDKVRLDYSSSKYNYFNLGGGLENKQDSLFSFKSSLSNHYKPFKIWTYIVNEAIYNTLVSNKNFSQNVVSDYFPKYRLDEKK